MRLRKLVKNLISISLILSLVFQSISYAAVDVNAGASDVTFQGLLEQDAYLGYAAKPRGARVSIWDVEEIDNPTCLRTQNVVMYEDTPYQGIAQTYENVSTFRCLSNMNKYDVAQLHGTLPTEMRNMIEGFSTPDYLGNHELNTESVSLPNMYATSAPAAERIEAIKSHFIEASNMNALIEKGLNFNEEEREKLNEGKVALLLEPLMTIYKVDTTNYTLNFWMLTSAELGTLALDGLADRGAYFDIDHLQSTAYKRLPYGSFKDEEGKIRKVPACPETQRVGKMCLTPLDWADMVNFLGCFEITARNVATESEIDPIPPVHNPVSSIYPNTEEMVLYEDELSYIYDYNSIDNTGVSRKLQGSV